MENQIPNKVTPTSDPDKTKTPWAKPLIYLTSLSLVIYSINRFIDHLLHIYNIHFLQNLYFADIGNLTNTLGGLGEVITAVLGIEITAVAIIVQLAANKYSSKVMDLFINNKINFIIIAIFIATSLNTLLVVNTLREDQVAYWSITFIIAAIGLSLIVVIPHFNYVFNFLRPENFLSYIRQDSVKIFNDLADGKKRYSDDLKEAVHQNITFVGDIAMNSVYQGDRAVTLLCLTTLREITEEYLKRKKDIPGEWFELSGNESRDPDFSNYSAFVLKMIYERKIVLERKVFRLYELIFNNSRVSLRDVASGVLLNTELISMASIKYKDNGVLHTTFQYFNSFLRSAITGKDPRSAFNTLEHYRIVAEQLLDDNPKLVEDISFYFKYYGQEANKYQVFFILETAAYDLCRLNELAFEKKVPNINELLKMFLNLDQEMKEQGDREKGERSLIGVRIAQAQLAGFYLLNEAKEMAKEIYEDMKSEPMHRIEKIRGIIFGTKNEEFWEITPRGINFNYIPPERRAALVEFFTWFGDFDIQAESKKYSDEI